MPDRSGSLDRGRGIFERRKFIRVGGTFVVSYTDITTQEQKTDVTQTKNISVGGILFTAGREFSADTVLRLKLRLPDVPDYINVKVKVMGSKQRIKGLMYDTRVKFIGIREEDRDAIRRIVEHHLKK